MTFTEEQRKKIYKRTDGRCHICRKSLVESSYAKLKAKGNWEIEHSKPQSKGGSHHLNNLYPACISCNRQKGNNSTKSARHKNGFKAAPLSKEAQIRERSENAIAGGIGGLIAGALLRMHPVGLVITTAIGLASGFNNDPEPD